LNLLHELVQLQILPVLLDPIPCAVLEQHPAVDHERGREHLEQGGRAPHTVQAAVDGLGVVLEPFSNKLHFLPESCHHLVPRGLVNLSLGVLIHVVHACRAQHAHTLL
jgi:hypothetical protein